MSQTILDTKRLTDAPDPSPELVLKVSHAMSQLCGAYVKLMETVALEDFDRRLTALESATPETHRHGTFP